MTTSLGNGDGARDVADCGPDYDTVYARAGEDTVYSGCEDVRWNQGW